MDDDIKLLNYIYQNSLMGVDTISQLIDIVENPRFKRYLQKKYHGYQKFHLKAKRLLHQHGYDERGIKKIDQIKTYLMINMQTLTDHSSSHIAKMLMVGSSMGIINTITTVKKCHKAKKEIIKLMRKLRKFEEESFSDLKLFL